MRLLVFLLASVITIITGQEECGFLEVYDAKTDSCVTDCGEGKTFNEGTGLCEDEIIQCGFLDVFNADLNRCVTDCGQEKVFNTETELCENSFDVKSNDLCNIECKSGETLDEECRCVKTVGCCIASASLFDIRVTSSEECNCEQNCETYGNKGYKCVDQHLCNKDCKIKTGGEGLITVYSTDDGCKRNIDLGDLACPKRQVCCARDEIETAPFPEVPRAEPNKNYSQCGRIAQNEQSFNLIDSRNPGKELNTYQAQLGEFPHMCLFSRLDQEGQRAYIGGASLISNKFLLTAAHKFYIKRGDATTDIRRNKRLFARCGELNVKIDEPNFPQPQEKSILKVFIHPEYNPSSLEHNIAIIQVKDPFKFENHISPVCLPQPNTDFDGYEDCWSTGWGVDSLDSPLYSDLLKKVKLSVYNDRKECERVLNDLPRFKENNKRFIVYDSWLCVGGEKGVDTCRGDGGSPHVCKVKQGNREKWIQVGAVAFGFGCGDGLPSIYSAVAPEMCWIDWVMSCSADAKSTATSVKDVVEIRQQQGGEGVQVVESVNNLKRRDCERWLQNQPDLIQQCKVNYK